MDLRLPAIVRGAMEAYLASLKAWADGACLDDLVAGQMADLRIEGRPVTATDLGHLFQTETIGCQTGMLRDAEGGVYFWHTEEDRDLPTSPRFDRLRLFTCKASPQAPSPTMTAFIYPDLMPGPAFGWCGPGYIQGVDAFYLDTETDLPGVPANAVTWICLHLGGAIPASRIVESLAPIHSGYVLSSLTRRERRVQAWVTEFLGNASLTEGLDDFPGAMLFRVNMLSQALAQGSPGRENLPPELRQALEARVGRVRRTLERMAGVGCDWDAFLNRLLASRVGGEFATSNPSVKASFLARMSADQTSYQVSPGPGIRPASSGAGDGVSRTID